jgi:biopolymer transport protein ExbD
MNKYFLFFAVLLACTHYKKGTANSNRLSLLIFNDSAIAYNGKLDKSTLFTKINPEEDKIKEILSRNKKDFGNQLQVLLKVSGEAGIMGNLSKIVDWIKETEITNFKIINPDENDIAIFKIQPFPLDYFNSSPTSLDLKLPRPEKKIKNLNPSLSLILLKDSIIYYRDNDLSYAKKTPYSGNGSIRSVIQEIKNQVPEKKFSIAIKPTRESGYDNIVAILDEMTINKVKIYEMTEITVEEESFFKIQSFLPEPPEPVQVTMPTSVLSTEPSKEPSFFIQIKNDGSIQYKTDSIDHQGNYIGLRKGDSTALSKAIATYKSKCNSAGRRERVYITGEKDSKYKDFEFVVNALKKNEIYNYNLITEPPL